MGATIVYGTRPEAIKLGPVVAELKALGSPTTVLCSGQHTDLLRGTPAETDLAGGASLGLASDGNVARWMAKAQDALIRALADAAVVVVQGDTMTALAAAQAANALGIPVAHVEAGLRSGDPDNPWPEETNRTAIAEIATLHLAPTERAAAQLRWEGVAGKIEVTGNTVVSALARYAPHVVPVAVPDPLVVVTLHRREIQTRKLARELTQGISEVAQAHAGWTFLWSIHPGFAKAHGKFPALPPNITMTPHMGYGHFVQNVARARLVVTDSGGLVEEAATLGTPTLILRDVNDRQEAVEVGIAVLAPPTREGLLEGTVRALGCPRTPRNCFGGPEAAQRSANAIQRLL